MKYGSKTTPAKRASPARQTSSKTSWQRRHTRKTTADREGADKIPADRSSIGSASADKATGTRNATARDATAGKVTTDKAAARKAATSKAATRRVATPKAATTKAAARKAAARKAAPKAAARKVTTSKAATPKDATSNAATPKAASRTATMRRLPAGKARMPAEPVTVEQLIREGAQQFDLARLWFGHGSDNAVDEAAELVFFAAGLRHEDAPAVYARALAPPVRAAVRALFQRRVHERVPAAYLTRRMWFAGHEFHVDERVLVPRSPIAELIEVGFEPWVASGRIRRVLDIGTGSGCIAVATALALPQARVDAADLSEEALVVAEMNIVRHGVSGRVRAVASDVYEGLAGRRYDLIVSNPPYVGDDEMRGLPREYSREPAGGLHGGRDGLDIVRRILRGAEQHLHPGGVLIVEVGNSEDALVRAFPRLPLTWLEFERGGGGVFVLTASQLKEHRAMLRMAVE